MSILDGKNVYVYMRCCRCGNEDPRYFYKDHGVFYCRKCIQFSRLDLGLEPKVPQLNHKVYKKGFILDYELTEAQKKASSDVLDYLKKGKDVFVYAATGAGKTEITFESISYYLSQGKKVAFAISRRQVVLEIKERLQKAFPSLKVIAVAQDYTSIVDGDIIVCTDHQLYRYPKSFDLLIMDEVDAFPYVNNLLLEEIAKKACIGQFLYLSATPDQKSLEEIKEGRMEMVTLFKRPHGHPLIIPKVKQASVFYQFLWILYYCQKWKEKQILLFVPKKQSAQMISKLLSFIYKSQYIHSSSKNKDEIMASFHRKEFHILVTTTLLERGITVPSVQVIVFEADHLVFTTASLIQIFGRVGRSFKDPTGEGICLCTSINSSIRECIEQLKQMNQSV